MPPITKSICPTSREDWRNWLKKNHQKEKFIWLIHHKRHTGNPFISHRESLEEAICFGWIDTTIKSIDENKYARCFRRRTEKGKWSTATLSYAKQLLKQKKMAPAGIKAYRLGLKQKPIDHGIEKNPEPQQDLLEALKKQGKALEYFNTLAPSYKRYYVRWIERAKRPETRQKRIAMVVQRVAEKKKPGIN